MELKYKVKKHLLNLEDKKYLELSKKLNVQIENYKQIGVRIPLIRNYAKELSENYELDYLTFNILSSGVIPWRVVTDGGTAASPRSIEYSINDGQWVSITAGAATQIQVVTGDVVRFRATNTKYCDGTNNKSYNGFDCLNVSNAATYNVEGNIMSLLYGDNFVDKVVFPSGSTFTFNSLFRQSNDIFLLPWNVF